VIEQSTSVFQPRVHQEAAGSGSDRGTQDIFRRRAVGLVEVRVPDGDDSSAAGGARGRLQRRADSLGGSNAREAHLQIDRCDPIPGPRRRESVRQVLEIGAVSQRHAEWHRRRRAGGDGGEYRGGHRAQGSARRLLGVDDIGAAGQCRRDLLPASHAHQQPHPDSL
jgi:hypothetical protein